ncbi:MAG: M28 family peptidase [Vicinamibacterales bacterium]
MPSQRTRDLLAAIVATVLLGMSPEAQSPPDRCLVPARFRDPILNEVSGELAHQHVQLLAANRDRQSAEYENQFFETTYISDMARQYGLSNVEVHFFPGGRDAWDAEEADLWMVAPARKKIASLTTVPAALASGSRSADVEAEVVYIGAGRESDFAGKDVKGKIVLGSGSVGAAFTAGVVQRGAAGALGTGSAGVSANSAGYTLDQIGWASVSAPPDSSGFGFNLSLRQFHEIRGLLERGEKVVMKAHVKTRTYPAKMNVVSASIPGTDPAAGELIFVAHAFETIATPGANDNCTGVATILEIGRALARLVREGALPPPRRTLRFIWVPEISGSTAYMFKFPELQDKLIAALNFDMTGANPKTTDSYLRMKMTPDSRPSYLNDLVANLLQFVDQTEIRTQQGANAQFNYRLAPVATITSGSDHSVFNNGGIPAMQFNYWPDNFYHSSGDRAEHADPTEMKRVGFTAAAAFYYLSVAGADEARSLAWEAASGGQKWIAEVTRQSLRLLGNDAAVLHERHKAAANKVTWAFNRARGGVEAVLRLSAAPEVASQVKMLTSVLEGVRDANLRALEAAYREKCAALGTAPVPIALTAEEREQSQLIPRRLFAVYSAEAQKRSSQAGRGAGPGGRGAGPAEAAQAAAARPPRMPGLASSEVANFIDGKRSILDIYNAVRAECGNLIVGNNEMKFAYVLSPDVPDIELAQVVAAIKALEASGTIEIVKKGS